MATIRNQDLAGDPCRPALIDHLMPGDFFFVQRFPKAHFQVRKVIPLTDATPTEPNYQIEGELEIRGIRRPLAFEATVNPAGEDQVAAEAQFDIDRTRWGVIYGSSRFFAHLGMHRVFDRISFDIRIAFRRAASSAWPSSLKRNGPTGGTSRRSGRCLFRVGPGHRPPSEKKTIRHPPGDARSENR